MGTDRNRDGDFWVISNFVIFAKITDSPELNRPSPVGVLSLAKLRPLIKSFQSDGVLFSLLLYLRKFRLSCP